MFDFETRLEVRESRGTSLVFYMVAGGGGGWGQRAVKTPLNVSGFEIPCKVSPGSKGIGKQLLRKLLTRGFFI